MKRSVYPFAVCKQHRIETGRCYCFGVSCMRCIIAAVVIIQPLQLFELQPRRHGPGCFRGSASEAYINLFDEKFLVIL